MLKKQDLVDNFAEPVDIGAGIIRCQDDTPRSTYYYYTRLASSGLGWADLLVVSENRLDDDFARLILGSVTVSNRSTVLTGLSLPSNKYGFSTVLLAPKDHHAYFKGVLDDKRDHLVLCLPVHYYEFSGEESAQEFILMRKEVVPSLDWERSGCPKIVFRFDNPKTRSGTGNKEVLAKYDLVLREIDNLNGVVEGFLEISNYKNRTIEILSPEVDHYVLIRDRNDEEKESVNKAILLEKLWVFLTA